MGKCGGPRTESAGGRVGLAVSGGSTHVSFFDWSGPAMAHNGGSHLRSTNDL